MKKLPQKQQKSKVNSKYKNLGLSMVELLLIVSIVGVLTTVTITVMNPAARINQARVESAKAKMKTLSNAIQAKQAETQKVMGAITNPPWPYNGCTACACLCVNAKTDATCISTSQNSWSKISSKAFDKDPWGNTYTFEENELEFNSSDCRYDEIISPGPDHIYGPWWSSCTQYGADDITIQAPHFYCP